MVYRFPPLIKNHVCRVVAVDQDRDIQAAGERAGGGERVVDDPGRDFQRIGPELQIKNRGYRHGGVAP